MDGKEPPTRRLRAAVPVAPQGRTGQWPSDGAPDRATRRRGVPVVAPPGGHRCGSIPRSEARLARGPRWSRCRLVARPLELPPRAADLEAASTTLITVRASREGVVAPWWNAVARRRPATDVVHERDARRGGWFRVSPMYDGRIGPGTKSERTNVYHGPFARLVPPSEWSQCRSPRPPVVTRAGRSGSRRRRWTPTAARNPLGLSGLPGGASGAGHETGPRRPCRVVVAVRTPGCPPWGLPQPDRAAIGRLTAGRQPHVWRAWQGTWRLCPKSLPLDRAVLPRGPRTCRADGLLGATAYVRS